MKITHSILLVLTLLGSSLLAETVNFVEPPRPYDKSPALQTAKGKVDVNKPIQIPIITWSADGVMIDLNKGLDANPSSPLAQALKHPATLKLQNVVDSQVADYISGKSPFFRGTSGQIALISGALKALDPDLEPITFIQLSRSTGADTFVAKNLGDLSELKGKTIITQLSGVHPEIIANILRDGGVEPTDVNFKYVKDISDPTWKAGKPVNDPANALRFTPEASGATMIDLDALSVTGGKVGTGTDGTVLGAKTTFSTKTAPNIIMDCIAVRKDFLIAHPEIVDALRKTHLAAQEEWLTALNGLKNKSKAEKQKLLDRARPLAKVILDDPNLAGDFLVWLSEGSKLAGNTGNKEFFQDSNPNGFKETTARVQEFYQKLGLISGPSVLVVNKPFPDSAAAPVVAATPVKKAFTTVEAVRKAAESEGANIMFKFTFQFNPQESEINWKDYPDIFKKINDTVTRYGGAIVQIRGHGDNFLYKFIMAKRAKGETTYQKKDKVTGEFSAPIALPDPTEILNDSKSLSYTRAFNVKKAFAGYVKDNLGLSTEEIDLSRFDVKGMGITQPLVENPKTSDERAKNMRCEIVIIAAESELPTDLSAGDLQ